MSRRTAERHQRRIEVRYWRRGETQPHSGFTVDLSKTGLYLGTSIALEPGERVRLEILDRANGFIVEGTVARVHRVSLALRHVEQPGVGIRFLTPGELVGEVISGGRSKSRVADSGRVERPAQAPMASTSASASVEAPRSSSSPADELFDDPQPAAHSTPAAEPAAEGPGPSRPARTVPVEFVDRASFLAVYHRDIEAGGLFVTSDAPAELHEVLLIELRPPVRSRHPLCFEARVVHRFDRAAGDGRSSLTGMGVQFLDPDRVRATLAPVLAELRR